MDRIYCYFVNKLWRFHMYEQILVLDILNTNSQSNLLQIY